MTYLLNTLYHIIKPIIAKINNMPDVIAIGLNNGDY